MECFMYAGRIPIIFLIISALLLVSGMVYGSAVILTATLPAFDGQLALPNQHSVAIVKRPACTWDIPAIIACYRGGLRSHPELDVIYSTPNTRQVLVSFELPGR
jgi:hypothetical protein